MAIAGGVADPFRPDIVATLSDRPRFSVEAIAAMLARTVRSWIVE
jgi:hypothetical protein